MKAFCRAAQVYGYLLLVRHCKQRVDHDKLLHPQVFRYPWAAGNVAIACRHLKRKAQLPGSLGGVFQHLPPHRRHGRICSCSLAMNLVVEDNPSDAFLLECLEVSINAFLRRNRFAMKPPYLCPDGIVRVFKALDKFFADIFGAAGFSVRLPRLAGLLTRRARPSA